MQSVLITTNVLNSNPTQAIQHYVIQFVSDFQQVGGFIRVLQFPPPIKLTATIYLKYKVGLNTINQPTIHNNVSFFSLLVFCLAITLPLLKLQVLKYVFTICTGTSLIAVGWFVFEKVEERQYEFSVLMFTIHVLIQLLLGLLTCYICSVKTKIRFLVYLYIFMLVGIILKISPSWLYHILVMKTIFYSVLIFLCIIQNGIGNSLKNLGVYFRKEELKKRLNDLIQNDRMDLFWYFLLMSTTICIHKWSIASNSEEYLGMKWVFFSTLGSGCNSRLALCAFYKFFTYMSILIFKACSAFIKGWDEQPIITPYYNITVVIMIADLLVYNMNPFERGQLFVSRFLILFVMLVEACSIMIGKVSSELEILQGSFLTSISVIVIHTVFIVFPVVVVDLLVNVYSMADLNIFLTTSNFVIVIGQAFVSLFLFLLYKYDSMRNEIWEHFDDVTFYIRLGCHIFIILINSFTVCFGVYTIFLGSHSFHGILRLYSLCYMNIYLVILQMKAMLYQRRQVRQFIAN